MTSVKEFRVEEAATPGRLGTGSFIFTDDYSVFDWGKMPDSIPNKGAALCAMGAKNFELLEEADIPTHYQGVVSNGTVKSLARVANPPREMAIDLTQVPDLPREGREYDYASFHAAADENYLIPLEIVFRNTVPVGSSLRRRYDPAALGLDFETWPETSVSLPEPVVEFSTKFEESDRYLPREEAQEIAGLADLDTLEEIALEANRIVTEQATSAGLTHEDGKIECLYFDGEVRVADVVGTFDENRFSYDGQQVSKEVIRQYHKRTQPAWVEAVSAAKSLAKKEGIADWRTLCEEDPEPLSKEVVTAMRDLYTAGTNAYIGMELFDAPTLAEAVEEVQDL